MRAGWMSIGHKYWLGWSAPLRAQPHEGQNEGLHCGPIRWGRINFEATRRRFAATAGPILVLHDTTEFSYRRKRPEAADAVWSCIGRSLVSQFPHGELCDHFPPDQIHLSDQLDAGHDPLDFPGFEDSAQDAASIGQADQ